MTATFRVHCQIVKDGERLIDQLQQVQLQQETTFAAPGFTANVTVDGFSSSGIKLVTDLQCGIRYVSPELEVGDGELAEIEFEGHAVRLVLNALEG